VKKFFLVTGGAGFIGSHIVEALLSQKELGQPVRVIDNFSTGKMENIAEAVRNSRRTSGRRMIRSRNSSSPLLEVIEGDITDAKTLERALKDVNIVFHEAALRSVPRSVDDPVSTNETNITGTLLLLKIAREMGVKRVIYASSSSVYGDSEIFPQKETQPPAPLSPYAVSKLAAENYCRVYSKTFGLETISLRYFNVFGPRQNPESKYAAVIPKFMESAISGKPFEIHGDGKQSRDFTYVSNVVKANLLAASIKATPSAKAGAVFNVACGTTHTVLDIARAIEKLTGKKFKRNYTPPRAGDVPKTHADISSITKQLKYKPEVGFSDGLRLTWEWFISNYKG